MNCSQTQRKRKWQQRVLGEKTIEGVRNGTGLSLCARSVYLPLSIFLWIFPFNLHKDWVKWGHPSLSDSWIRCTLQGSGRASAGVHIARLQRQCSLAITLCLPGLNVLNLRCLLSFQMKKEEEDYIDVGLTKLFWFERVWAVLLKIYLDSLIYKPWFFWNKILFLFLSCLGQALMNFNCYELSFHHSSILPWTIYRHNLGETAGLVPDQSQ